MPYRLKPSDSRVVQVERPSGWTDLKRHPNADRARAHLYALNRNVEKTVRTKRMKAPSRQMTPSDRLRGNNARKGILAAIQQLGVFTNAQWEPKKLKVYKGLLYHASLAIIGSTFQGRDLVDDRVYRALNKLSDIVSRASQEVVTIQNTPMGSRDFANLQRKMKVVVGALNSISKKI